MGSKVIIATALDARARIYQADTTESIEKARVLHDLWPSSCAALGRSLSITSVMGAMLKNDDECITTIINGRGPIGTIMCIAKGDGTVKGFCGDNAIYLKRNSDNSLIVGEIVGNDGYLKVIKDLKLKSNYSSDVKLQTGEISEDYAYYFRVSEQTPCIVSSGVNIGPHYNVEGAGCILIELMPGYSEDDIKYLENLVKIINDNPVSILVKNNIDLVDYLKSLFKDLVVLNIKYIEYKCDCSRDKFYNNLKALPKKDIEDLCSDDNIEIKCEFCNKRYIFNKDELEKLIK